MHSQGVRSQEPPGEPSRARAARRRAGRATPSPRRLITWTGPCQVAERGAEPCGAIRGAALRWTDAGALHLSRRAEQGGRVTLGLPEFDAPPLVESTLAVQFETLGDLQAHHLGVFARELELDGHQFEELSEDLPRDVYVERLGGPSVRRPFRLELAESPPPPRLTLTSDKRRRGLAVQRDLIEYTWWRAEATEVYPRYSALVEEFLPIVEAFDRFTGERKLGPVRPRQVEVIYRNALQQGVDWQDDISQVLRTLRPATAGVPGDLEDWHAGQRHLVRDDSGTPVGRLLISFETGHPSPWDDDGSDETTWAALSLTYRGVLPGGSERQEAKAALDHGRAVIVRAFTATTSDEAHTRWRRTA